ncbi:MAG: DUF6062 family protein [Chloroflexi bacterium]|nr:DUF6062 family protein [Chloroflexota bacterium]
MPRDLSTIDLEIAFEQAGCPICHLVLQKEKRWLWSLLWENVNDPGIRAGIAASWGFCYEHAWKLAALERDEFGSCLGTAIIYEDLVNRLWRRSKSKGITKGSGDGYREVRWTPGEGKGLLSIIGGRSCPACIANREMEEIYLSWLVVHCAEDWFATLYRDSTGMCLNHLKRALQVAGRSDVRRFLLEVQLEKLSSLKEGDGDQGLSPLPEAIQLSTQSKILNLMVGANRRWAKGLKIGMSSAELLERAGCPICMSQGEAERLHLQGLLEEEGGDKADDWPSAWLCREHAWMLYGLGEPYRSSLISLYVSGLQDLSGELHRLHQVETSLRGERRPLLTRWRWDRGRRILSLPPTCPICDRLREDELEQTVRFREALSIEGQANSLQQGHALCLPHLRLTLSDQPLMVDKALIWSYLTRIEELSSQLREYIRKHDWRFRDEPRGEEQMAWFRAIELFVGSHPHAYAEERPHGYFCRYTGT